MTGGLSDICCRAESRLDKPRLSILGIPSFGPLKESLPEKHQCFIPSSLAKVPRREPSLVSCLGSYGTKAVWA